MKQCAHRTGLGLESLDFISDAASVYKYMNFDQIEEYAEVAKSV